MLSLGLKNNDTLEYTSTMSEKLSEIYFDIVLFCNPGEKVEIIDESKGPIWIQAFIVLRTSSSGLKNINTLQWISNNVPVILTYVLFLEN